MEFYTVIAMVMTAATLSFTDASAVVQLGSGSYTDSLIGGVSRLANKVHARPVVGAVVKPGLDQCNGLCPLGTVCALELGVYRCVSRTEVALVDPGFGVSNFDLNDGRYDSGIGLRSGAATIGIGNKARFVSNGFDRNLGISTCGFMAPECRSTRRDFNAVFKYTFSHTLNRCVRVSVCMTCAHLNGPEDNLFDSQFQCARFCH